MLILTNAEIVTPRAVFRGTLTARKGRIEAVDTGVSAAPGAIDCDGDYLVPGLIDLHTDALQHHLTPRPRVVWPLHSALAAHDGQMATAGVTTVFDAMPVCVGLEDEPQVRARAHDAVTALQHQDEYHLRAEHFLHIRLELPHPETADAFREFADLPILRMVSIMDHTPGQGQYADIELWRRSFRNAEMAEQAERRYRARLEYRELYAAKNRDRIAEAAKQRGLPLASHDDRTLEDVARGKAAGVTISEFPVTLQAAEAAQANGLAVIMGGPNLVLGGSHSGNAAAADVAAGGWLDGLTSDYVPASMLHGAFLLHTHHGMPLPEAIAKVTSAPALMAGMNDRGSLEAGRRADLVRVRCQQSSPRVMSVWRSAVRVA